MRDEEKEQRARDGAPKGANGRLQKRRGDDILKAQGSDGMSIHRPIDSPIEQRNTGKGNPNAILQYDRPLNNRQKALLEQLPTYDSKMTIKKHDVNMHDLSALTAITGSEFAMFTKAGERLIIRGNAQQVNVTEKMAHELAQMGYRWSGHTHPGEGINVRIASPGDKAILKQFRQDMCAIWDQHGNMQVFERDD